MTRNTSTTARRIVTSALAAFALAAALPQAGFAASSNSAIWTVNLAKSKFSPGVNTLVIQPKRGAKAAQAKASPAGSTFLVIYDGNIYLATDTLAGASSGTRIKEVDYARWSDMKLVQIGENVHALADVCGFRCRAGLTDSRGITLTFTAKGIDPSGQMNKDVLVSNRR